jgi:hypothetical protein
VAFGNPANSFEVRLDNAPLLSLGPPGPLGAWSPFATSFTATSASHTISFAGETNGSDHDYGVDNISVVIPEPASAALTAAAMAIAIVRRRQFSATSRPLLSSAAV